MTRPDAPHTRIEGGWGVIGRTYLERGRPVTVLTRWVNEGRNFASPHVELWWPWNWRPLFGPRNVLIRREDGTLVTRPFRGLRRLPSQDPARA